MFNRDYEIFIDYLSDLIIKYLDDEDEPNGDSCSCSNCDLVEDNKNGN